MMFTIFFVVSIMLLIICIKVQKMDLFIAWLVTYSLLAPMIAQELAKNKCEEIILYDNTNYEEFE